MSGRGKMRGAPCPWGYELGDIERGGHTTIDEFVVRMRLHEGQTISSAKANLTVFLWRRRPLQAQIGGFRCLVVSNSL